MVLPAFPEVGRPPHHASVGLDVDRATDVAKAADGFGGIQFPRVMPEVAVGEGADRTNGDAHPTVGAVGFGQIFAEGGGDRRFQPAVARFDRDHADHLVADPSAAAAHDATVPLIVD